MWLQSTDHLLFHPILSVPRSQACPPAAAVQEKIEAGGGTVVEVPAKPTWTRKLHKERLADPKYKAPTKVSRLAKKGVK